VIQAMVLRGRGVVASATAVVCALLSFLPGLANGAVLHPGDIVVSDFARDQIIRVDPAGGAEAVITSGGFFDNPADLVVDPAGKTVYVTDFVANVVVRVDVATGAQSAVASLANPSGITWDETGGLLVTGSEIAGSLFRVDPVTGETRRLTSGLGGARGLAVAADGAVYIANFLHHDIIRFDRATGQQTTISRVGLLQQPFDIAIDAGGDLLVANEHGHGIVRVDPGTGAQSLVAAGMPPFRNPLGVAIDSDGAILAANAGYFDQAGGIVRVDPATGRTTTLSPAGFLHGIDVVVPEPTPAFVFPIALVFWAIHRRPLARHGNDDRGGVRRKQKRGHY
jgi:DNA-binding beta-propeller fold protein YncE